MVDTTRHEYKLDEEEPSVHAELPKNYIESVPQAELAQPISVKRRYICDYAKYLTRDDFRELGLLLKAAYLPLMKENSDGTRVDLDQIKDVEIINLLYASVRFKISQRK